MPLRLDIKRILSATSERVKCCDIHPTEPWILSALYSGHLFIWNYDSQTLVKSIEVCDLPIRCAKFIPSKQWIACGSDDMQIRIYNYNTMERIRTFEAHTDYIRSISVHPSKPYILTSSDDMFIKLWDWEQDWECRRVFEGHTHYVMQVEFNPKDTNTFVSASLDRTVKVWGLNATQPHFSLEGHERGVNCIGYYRGGDKPYIVSGADDHMIKIWDYQTKACVATLEGHTNNVSAVTFHPQLPVIISGSEDGTTRVWHANTYRLESTLNYGMERVWSISCLKGSNKVAVGYDDGTVMIGLGHDEPVVSMERGGKIVWAKNHEVMIANGKGASKESPADGDRLSLPVKDLGNCEVYPQSISHNANGRLICVCGDGEYIIYTALALKNKSFGSALEFVWGLGKGVHATRESSSRVKLFKDFKEAHTFRPTFAAESIFGGTLLGVRSADFIDFYDWDEARIVRRIDVVPKNVYWSEGGDMVVLACESSFYVLRYNQEITQKFFDSDVEVGEQGIETSFELEEEISETVETGHFVGDCFIYTNASKRLNYYVGGEVMTLAHLDKTLFMLGYLPKENRVYLMDKSHNIVSYSLLVSVLVYQTAIVRRDLDAAAQAFDSVPAEQHLKIARFLEAQDLKEMALEISPDPEHRFELAIQLGKLALARQLLEESEEDASPQRWKQLGDIALSQDFNLELAQECFQKSEDLGGLLLLYTSLCDADGMAELATMARAKGRHNVAFICYLLLHRVSDCIELLCETDRVPEAAFMTRTYQPSDISRILTLWKANLSKVSEKAAQSLANPDEYPELFPDLETAVLVEQYLQKCGQNSGVITRKPTEFAESAEEAKRNLIRAHKNGELDMSGVPTQPVAAAAAAVDTSAADAEAAAAAEKEAAAAAEKEAAAAAEKEAAAAAEKEAAAAAEKEAAAEKAEAEKAAAADKAKVEDSKEAPAAAATTKAADDDLDIDALGADLDDLGVDVTGDGDDAAPSLDELNASLAEFEKADDW